MLNKRKTRSRLLPSPSDEGDWQDLAVSLSLIQVRAKTFKGQSKKKKGEQHEFQIKTLTHSIRLTLPSFFASSHLLRVLQMDISLSGHRHAAI